MRTKEEYQEAFNLIRVVAMEGYSRFEPAMKPIVDELDKLQELIDNLKENE